MNNFYKNIIFLSLMFCSSTAFGSGTNFNDTTNKAAPLNNPSFTGNVGIGSLTPGQALDVQGTVRATYFIGNGSQLTNLSASGWTSVGNNIYNTNIGNVGINTTNGFNVGIGTSSPQGKLVVMNGNVGIGTLVPSSPLTVEGALSSRVTNSTVSFTAYSPAVNNPRASYLIGNSVSDINDGMYVSPLFSSNALQIPSYISATTDQTVTDANEEEIYMSVGYTTGGIQVGAIGTSQEDNSAGTNGFPLVLTTQNAGLPGMYMDNAAFQNVGIGTITPKGGLVIMNGNVGIGTWIPGGALIVQSGNVGIGTTIPAANVHIARDSSNTISVLQLGAATLTSPNASGTYLGINAPNAFNGNFLDFQNNGTDEFIVDPLGNGYLNTGLTTTYIKRNAGDLLIQGFYGSGAPSDYAVTIEYAGGNGTTSGILGSLVVGSLSSPFNPTSGTAVYNDLDVTGVINQTGGANGITRGVYVSPTLTSAYDFRAIETAVGNVGIGTISGNLGIGSQWPGQRLDVNGTARMSGFNLTGNGAGSGNVLVGNGIGVGTWMAASTLPISGGAGTNYWLLNGVSNVGINTTQSVGIGTSFVGGAGGEAALSIMNGNVGIGTWKPGNGLEVARGGITIDSSGINMPSAGGFVDMADGDYINWNSVSIQGGSSWIYVSAGYEEISGNLEVDQNGVIGKDYAGVDNGPADGLLVEGNVGIGTFTSSSRLNVNGGVGIGTTSTSGAYLANAAPAGGLIVQGNVGIGTFNPFGGKLIVSGGNVGVGSLTPGQLVDVQGTVRTTGFTMSGQTPVSGYVLTASDSAGDTTWASEGAIGGWSVSGNNVYETKGGNVGIGTIRPVAQLAVAGNGVGIGTNMNDAYLTTTPPSGGMIIEGNVGIGTPAPMDALQIGNQWIFENGGFKVIGYNTWYNPSNGQDTYFLNGPASRIAQTSNGEVIMQVAGTGVAGGFQTWADGARLYANGNFGVGGTGLSAMPSAGSQLTVYGGTSLGVDYFTTAAPTNGLIVEGNVGVGTFNPFGGNLIINGGGNVGIGTLVPNGALDVGAGTICLGHVCNSTWPAGGSNYWLLNGVSNVGINTTQSVGIGTSFVGGAGGEAALSIMNGNVGIGTWVPGNSLDIKNGNIGIGTAYSLIGIGTTSTILTMHNDTSSIYLGWQAGYASSGGDFNTAVGTQALYSNTTGVSNTAIGNTALYTNTTGFVNTAVGIAALYSNTVGTSNTAMGTDALYYSTTGNNNSAFGNQAGEFVLGGVSQNVISNNSIYLGYKAEALASGDTNEIVIGSSAVGIGSYSVELGNNTIATTQLQGNVGIGTWVPGSALQVVGNVGVGTSAAGSTPRTLQINNIAVFNSEYNNGSPSSPITINWAKGNKQAVTLTATGMTVNFTNPSVGVGAFQLKVIQDGTGARTVTAWTPSSGNIYWSGGSAPTLTTTATYLDIVSCYYDGTNYYCATTLNFQ